MTTPQPRSMAPETDGILGGIMLMFGNKIGAMPDPLPYDGKVKRILMMPFLSRRPTAP